MSVDPLIAAITPPSDLFVVLRPFQGKDDIRYSRGEVVDTNTWIHKDRLVELRYVSPLPHGAKIPTKGSDGRMFISLNEEQEVIVPQKKRPVPTR